MSDESKSNPKRVTLNEGYQAIVEKGYSAIAPTVKVSGGYQGETNSLPSPPSGGSSSTKK